METQQRFRFFDFPLEIRLDIYNLWSVISYLGNIGIPPLMALSHRIFSEATQRFEHAVKQHITQQWYDRVRLENCENDAPEGHKFEVLNDWMFGDLGIMCAEICLARITILRISLKEGENVSNESS